MAAHSTAACSSAVSMAAGPWAAGMAARSWLQNASRAAGARASAASRRVFVASTTESTMRAKPAGSRALHSAPQVSLRNIRLAVMASCVGSPQQVPAATVSGGPSELASVSVVSMRGCQPPMADHAALAGDISAANGNSTTASRGFSPCPCSQAHVFSAASRQSSATGRPGSSEICSIGTMKTMHRCVPRCAQALCQNHCALLGTPQQTVALANQGVSGRFGEPPP